MSFPARQAEAVTPTAPANPATKAKARAEVVSDNTEEEAKAETIMEEDTPTTIKDTEKGKKNQEGIDTEEILVMTERREERTSNQKKIGGFKRSKISIIVKNLRRDTKMIAGKKTGMTAMTKEET